MKFEALIRWQHPTKGLVPPDQFITFAEESGQIIEVGHWVIQEAKRALKAIQEVHGKHVQISVNVSPVQLSQYQGEKAQLLEELLVKSSDGQDARNGLVVEITENLLMNSDESTRNALLAFREQGVQVALDDFGTGYSSLAYIMNYDIDYLKIDQSFVQKLESEKASQTLCEAIISMAHALGVAVIAEGVETQKQADLLLGYHCDYLQGFYFSRPIPLDQALLYKREK
ncbi:MAG: EAL domain-containing protein [Marinomonas sp.]